MRVRLVKPCRGYRKGEVIEVPDDLAIRLVDSGSAVSEPQNVLIEPRRIERAVFDLGDRTAAIE